MPLTTEDDKCIQMREKNSVIQAFPSKHFQKQNKHLVQSYWLVLVFLNRGLE